MNLYVFSSIKSLKLCFINVCVMWISSVNHGNWIVTLQISPSPFSVPELCHSSVGSFMADIDLANAKWFLKQDVTGCIFNEFIYAISVEILGNCLRNMYGWMMVVLEVLAWNLGCLIRDYKVTWKLILCLSLSGDWNRSEVQFLTGANHSLSLFVFGARYWFHSLDYDECD